MTIDEINAIPFVSVVTEFKQINNDYTAGLVAGCVLVLFVIWLLRAFLECSKNSYEYKRDFWVRIGLSALVVLDTAACICITTYPKYIVKVDSKITDDNFAYLREVAHMKSIPEHSQLTLKPLGPGENYYYVVVTDKANA